MIAYALSGVNLGVALAMFAVLAVLRALYLIGLSEQERRRQAALPPTPPHAWGDPP